MGRNPLHTPIGYDRLIPVKRGKIVRSTEFRCRLTSQGGKWANVWFTVSQQRTSTAVTANHRPQAFCAWTPAPLAAVELTKKLKFKCYIILYHSIALEMLFQKSFGSNSIRRSVWSKMARKQRVLRAKFDFRPTLNDRHSNRTACKAMII